MKREMKMMVLTTVACLALMLMGVVPAAAQSDYCEPFNTKITKKPYITENDGYLLYDGNDPVYTDDPKGYAEYYYAGEVDPDDQQLMWGDLTIFFPGGWVERVGMFDSDGNISDSWGGVTFVYFYDSTAKGHRLARIKVMGETIKTYVCLSEEAFFNLIDAAKMTWFENEPVVPLFKSTQPRVYTYEQWKQDNITRLPRSIYGYDTTSDVSFETARKLILGVKNSR